MCYICDALAPVCLACEAHLDLPAHLGELLRDRQAVERRGELRRVLDLLRLPRVEELERLRVLVDWVKTHSRR